MAGGSTRLFIRQRLTCFVVLTPLPTSWVKAVIHIYDRSDCCKQSIARLSLLLTERLKRQLRRRQNKDIYFIRGSFVVQ